MSLLDQAIVIGNGAVKNEDVKNMLAIPDRQMIASLFYNCYIGDIKKALSDAECFISNEIDVSQLVSEIMSVVIDGLKLSSGVIDIQEIPQEYYQYFNNLVDDDNLNIPRLLRMWQVLSSSLQEIHTIQARNYLIALIYKLCYSSTLPTPVEAIKLLDKKMQQTLSSFPDGKIIE